MSNDNSTTYQAYCVKCRIKRDMQGSQAVFTKTGTPGTRGACPECGTNLFRMGATPAHEGLSKPENVAKPARKKAKPKTKAKRKSKSRATKTRTARRNVGKLVIVESPAKARSIGGFLGDGYTVMSSKGHVRDLLKSRLSVDVEANFEPEYRVPNDKRAVVKELRAAADGADEIYLATDPDREGEAIAWHLVAAAEMPPSNVRRVVFHEITDGAVADAFAHPRDINMDLVNAQQARRILDRLVGYQVSQLLWSKVRNGLSAGRVQSIALRFVVEREQEISAFVAIEHWSIDAKLAKTANGEQVPFVARLAKIADTSVKYDPNGNDPPSLDCEATSAPHVEILRRSLFAVDSVKRGTRQDRPSAPFTTSTLQQAASNRRGYGATRTMRIAQDLYEGIDLGSGQSVGLITYMRTDSVQVSQQAQAEARNYIVGQFGESFAPKSPPKYKTKAKGAQEAHEAIRPTSVSRTPEAMKPYLSGPQLQIYTLVWNRFVASQMSPAVYDTMRIEIKAGSTKDNMPYLFRAAGRQLRFAGHLAITGKEGKSAAESDGSGNQIFPELVRGEMLERLAILPEQHFTQPPPRYTEASLIRQLEEKGIGRPSTYAPTVSVIQTRDYVTKESRKLIPTKTGVVVSELLAEYFDVEMNYEFTANMEDQLDDVSNGKLDWRPMLDEFYHPFEKRLDNARENMPRRDVAEKIGRTCPGCGDGDLVVKHSRYGKFIGCSNYPDCKHTERFLERLGFHCPQCGDREQGEVVERRSRKGRPFFGCSRYPDCDFTVWKLPGDLIKLDDPQITAAAREPSVI